MATTLLVALALVGAAARAEGSGPPERDTCSRQDGAACGAGDHSLLQVVSRPSAHGGERSRHAHAHKRIPASGGSTSGRKQRRAVELLDKREALPAQDLQPGQPVNRTIENITKAIHDELKDLEDFANLLVLGRHKLCAAEEKNADRVGSLMALLRSKSVLQVGASESPQQKGQGLEEVGKAHDGKDKWLRPGHWFSPAPSPPPPPPPPPPPVMEPVAEVPEVVKQLEMWFKPEQPDEKDPVTETVKDLPEPKPAIDNRTLTNITSDVGTEVGDVEKVMSDIRAEGDRLEVIATGTWDRCKILLSVLSTETQQCESGGEYSYGGMLQAGKQSHDPKQTAEQVQQSTLQTSRTHAINRFTKEELEKYFKPSHDANQSITYWHLTETIKNITTQLENDINALMAEKNMLSVAGSDGVSHLDNLEDTMQGQIAAGEALLQRGANVSDAAPGGNATQQKAVAFANVNSSTADNATLTEQLQAAEIRRLKEEINRKETAHSSAQVGQQQAVSSATAHVVPDVGDLAIVNLTFGVDKQVVKLESDVGILGEQKHAVCWVTKDAMDKINLISTILKTVPC